MASRPGSGGVAVEAEWSLSYPEYSVEREGTQEALFAVGNGYFGTRGAQEEAAADDVNYPGTYIAGVYNRLTSRVAERDVENEDFVNCPNWLPITFMIEDGEWFQPGRGELLDFTRTLDFRTGLLSRTLVVRDDQGRKTRVESRRLAGMANPHIAALRYSVTPLNYAGRIAIRSGLDGALINAGVARYRQLESRHLEPLTGEVEGLLSHLLVRTNQSGIEIAEAARLTAFRDGREVAVEVTARQSPGTVYSTLEFDGEEGVALSVEKVVTIFTSLDREVKSPLAASRSLLAEAGGFDDILQSSARAWAEIWEKIDIEIEGDRLSQKLIRLHLYHSMVAASPHTADLDVGIPARGLHGEAYRGHIFWDELFILPLYNMQFPETARGTLLYRYRRLDQARAYARAHGFDGAMYPWQSGSDGREETQVVHLNPVSGEWGGDYSSLQRHISLAIPFSTWEYYWTTKDIAFLEEYGAEMFLEICRFWAGKSEYNEETGRYEIRKVMGPDEFHEKYADTDEGGLKDNSYTNIMVVWVLKKSFAVLAALSSEARRKVLGKIKLTDEELAKWKQITARMNLCISAEGVLEQFDGYFGLEELDWDAYRAKHTRIGRMDRLLKAEGKSADNYKVAKQADALMPFYVLPAHEIAELVSGLGYPARDDMLRTNFDYYLKRTSHGSTLSKLVHAHLANLAGNRDLSLELFMQALRSDFEDSQGGTTREGVHCGVMTGTANLVLASYAGLDLTRDCVTLTPRLPDAWRQVRFSIRFNGDRYSFVVAPDNVKVRIDRADKTPVTVTVAGHQHTIPAGQWTDLDVS